jgi:C-terminal processing protease CtpA/Prc
MTGKNHLQIGNTTLLRLYPKFEDEPKYIRYFKTLNTEQPYIEQLNEKTLYFRIPSFLGSEKQKIDSIIKTNREKILSTENLIIDIRNGTGGSDGSYEEILPFIYTNQIRSVGVEFLSTKLNNQRMLDFINKPEYGFDEDGKKSAKTAYDKLDKEQGKFVNLDENIVTITKYDTIYPYPKNVGIIINQRNGSTDEQFLLAAKQSKKVKLFGTTTYGVLDISNMYFVPSPCNNFQLGYSLSRSMRIPDFTIDEKGIQPDYYLDKSIPQYEWTEYVNKILNGQ